MAVQIGEHAVVRGGDDRLVEGDVRVDERPGIGVLPGLVTPAQGGTQRGHVLGGTAFGRQPGGVALQSGTDLQRLQMARPAQPPQQRGTEIVGGAYIGPVPLARLQHAAVDECAYGLAHGVAPDTEQFHQDRLGGNLRTDRPLPGFDQGLQLVDHPSDQAGALRRAQRHVHLQIE